MSRLIKLQIRNIFHNKLFYICLILLFILSELFTIINLFLSKTPQLIKVLPEVINLLSSELGIISTIFVTILATFDFTEGTAKNIIARGYSKVELLLSKYIASLIGLFSMYGIIILVLFVLFIKNGLGYDSSMPIMLVYILFTVIAYTVLYVTIAFLLEKNSSAIIANLILPNIIMLALTLIDANLNTKIGDYWIASVGSKFLDSPTLGNLGFPILMYLIYIGICLLISVYVLRGKEVK